MIEIKFILRKLTWLIVNKQFNMLSRAVGKDAQGNVYYEGKLVTDLFLNSICPFVSVFKLYTFVQV